MYPQPYAQHDAPSVARPPARRPPTLCAQPPPLCRRASCTATLPLQAKRRWPLRHSGSQRSEPIYILGARCFLCHRARHRASRYADTRHLFFAAQSCSAAPSRRPSIRSSTDAARNPTATPCDNFLRQRTPRQQVRRHNFSLAKRAPRQQAPRFNPYLCTAPRRRAVSTRRGETIHPEPHQAPRKQARRLKPSLYAMKLRR